MFKGFPYQESCPGMNIQVLQPAKETLVHNEPGPAALLGGQAQAFSRFLPVLLTGEFSSCLKSILWSAAGCGCALSAQQPTQS